MIRISTLSKLVQATRLCQISPFHGTALKFGVKGMELRMPALSPTMSQGTIVKWLKKEGDAITPGDSLCEIQTDKAVMTFDIEEEGILAKILLPDDTKDIKIGTLIGMLVEEGQDWKDVEVPTSASPTMAVSLPEARQENTTSNTHTGESKKFIAGPATKKLLLEYGLEKSEIAASGPKGTLLKGDVLNYVNGKKLKPVLQTSDQIAQKTKSKQQPMHTGQKKTPKTVPGVAGIEQVYVDVPNSEQQMILAASAVRSKITIPHSYCSVDCEVDDILGLCRRLQEDFGSVSLNDFVLKAAALALQRVPEVNARLSGHVDGDVQLLTDIDIALDMHDEDGVVVIIRDAIGRSVNEISKNVQKFQSAANRHPPLTVSNLGLFGVTEFTEIVREDQTAVLAIGTSRTVIDNEGSVRSRLMATLSYDARVFDEPIAAKFLAEFASAIGNPSTILVSLGRLSASTAANSY